MRFEDDFIEVNKIDLWERNISLGIVLGVGCEFFDSGFTTVKSNMLLSGDLFKQAVLIYGYDLLVQNPDRLEHNPNCAFKGNRMIAFDFDQSLSFIYPIIGTVPEPWEFSKLKFQAHIFLANLRAKRDEIDWIPFLEKLRQMSKQKLENICSFIPPEFGNHTQKICEHFLSIETNFKQIEFELYRSLG